MSRSEERRNIAELSLQTTLLKQIADETDPQKKLNLQLELAQLGHIGINENIAETYQTGVAKPYGERQDKTTWLIAPNYLKALLHHCRAQPEKSEIINGRFYKNLKIKENTLDKNELKEIINTMASWVRTYNLSNTKHLSQAIEQLIESGKNILEMPDWLDICKIAKPLITSDEKFAVNLGKKLAKKIADEESIRPRVVRFDKKEGEDLIIEIKYKKPGILTRLCSSKPLEVHQSFYLSPLRLNTTLMGDDNLENWWNNLIQHKEELTKTDSKTSLTSPASHTSPTAIKISQVAPISPVLAVPKAPSK